MPDPRLVAKMVPDRREVAFRVNQHPLVFVTRACHAFLQRGRFAIPAAASIDDDGTQLSQNSADQWKLFQMVAGHERKILHFRVDEVSVAPALVLRREDEGTVRKVASSTYFLANSGDDAKVQIHRPCIAADDHADRAAPRKNQERQRYQHVKNRENIIDDCEDEAAHCRGSFAI